MHNFLNIRSIVVIFSGREFDMSCFIYYFFFFLKKRISCSIYITENENGKLEVLVIERDILISIRN